LSPPPAPLSRAPSFFTHDNFWLSFFHLWALTLNGEATYTPPGTFDGYTLMSTTVVAEAHSVVSGGAFGASFGAWRFAGHTQTQKHFMHCLAPWVQLDAPCTCTHTL
jgi:hypothetical protein